MKTPVSTYRIQVRQGFPLHSVAQLADYLADLGADWAYLSPLLEAEAGSDHGYDVIRHDRIDPARGGDEGLVEASSAMHAAGLGVLIDIVPNHVGVATPSTNPWWWDVLRLGRDSAYACCAAASWCARIALTSRKVPGTDLREGVHTLPVRSRPLTMRSIMAFASAW